MLLDGRTNHIAYTSGSIINPA